MGEYERERERERERKDERDWLYTAREIFALDL